jgi:hypothetical protein
VREQKTYTYRALGMTPKPKPPSNVLRKLGVRFWFDQVECDHSAESGAHWSSLETLNRGPPVCVASPIIGLVAIDTVMFMHAGLAPPLVQYKLLHKDGIQNLTLWGVEVSLVTVTPPAPVRLFEYICRDIYGCRCPRCKQNSDLSDIASYMSCGASVEPLGLNGGRGD